MTENQIAKEVVDCAYHIHKKLGPGLFEKVYEAILQKELQKRGMTVQRQLPVPLVWDDMEFEEAFRADLIINEKLLVELKSVEALNNAHKKQVLTYLKLTGLKLGILINFGEALIKDGIHRIVNEL